MPLSLKLAIGKVEYHLPKVVAIYALVQNLNCALSCTFLGSAIII